MKYLKELQDRVREEVLAKIKPTIGRRKFINQIVESAMNKIREHFQSVDQEIQIRLEGSLEKDTWISSEADADVFVLFPIRYEKQDMGKITTDETIRIFGRKKCTLRYAEHPYVTVDLGRLDIDVVPCYNTEPPNWKSATDRTIHHTKFIVSNFDERLKDEARLLKAFMRGIGKYGAEIKTGGFSGFLCELLIFHFGSFAEVLKAFSELKLPLVVDVKGYHRSKSPEEISSRFNSEFIVVDPTDADRNVASAVADESLQVFVWASRRFLQRPSEDLFFHKVITPKIKKKVVDGLRKGLLEAVALRFPTWQTPPDVLWGQLHKIRKRFETRLLEVGYNVIRSTDWSDERSQALILYILESNQLPKTELREGPHVLDYENSETFLSKYREDERLVSGPFIRNGRWHIVISRSIYKAKETLLHPLKEEKFLKGMPEQSVSSIKNSKVFAGRHIPSSVRSREGKEFILRFLHGKEWWL